MRTTANALVHGVGFSNGCAELALKKPPPLVPSCLMASCEATGPPRTDWVPPASVVISVWGSRFWTTPAPTSTSAATNASGSSTRTVPRTRSAQKLPTRPSVPERANPRASAARTARPTAADRKFCTASPAIWNR